MSKLSIDDALAALDAQIAGLQAQANNLKTGEFYNARRNSFMEYTGAVNGYIQAIVEHLATICKATIDCTAEINEVKRIHGKKLSDVTKGFENTIANAQQAEAYAAERERDLLNTLSYLQVAFNQADFNLSLNDIGDPKVQHYLAIARALFPEPAK